MTATAIVQTGDVKADDNSVPDVSQCCQSQQNVKLPMQADGIVRLSRVEVYPEHLDEYLKMAVKVGQISLQTEPGVLTMYALSEKEHPNIITILETYAS